MAQPGAAVVDERGFLDKFPWYVQLLVLLALVAVIIFAVDYFLFLPDRDKTAQINQEVQELVRQNQEADIIRNNIVEYEKTLADLNTQFDELKVRLPEQREVTQIFENARSLVGANGLQLIQYRTGGSEVPKPYYTEVPSTIVVAGSYSKVQALFQDLAVYQRILNVSDIVLEKAPPELQARQASVKASFTVTAFYISTQNLQNLENDAAAAAAPAPGQPGAAPAGGAPAPAPPT